MNVANTRIESLEGLHVVNTTEDLKSLEPYDWNVYIDGDKSTLVSYLKHLGLLRKRLKNTVRVHVLNESLRPLAKVWCSSVFHLEYLEEGPTKASHEVTKVPEELPKQEATFLEPPKSFVAYCINLDRRKDRWNAFEENFQAYKMPYERVSAVEDKNGALGCAKSHLSILHAHKDDDYIFIAEDDATIQEPILSVMQAFLKTSADILMLGYNTRVFKPYDDVFFRVTDAYTTSCYLVKKHAVPHLIRSFEKSARELQRGLKNPIDLEWHKLQKQLTFVVPKKHLVIQRESFSDIEQRVVNYRV